MEVAIILAGWQLSIMLARTAPGKNCPDLKLPTDDEITVMLKECYRRFREAIKKQRGQFEPVAHHR